MDNDRKRINIMTSCDDNLTDYIFIQIRTMAMHLKNKEIYFYILYNNIKQEKLNKLETYCRAFGNIIFNEILIEDMEPYKKLAEMGSLYKREGGKTSLPPEGYFAIGSYKYLPEEVDRILYIDAGDVLFAGEIDEFYFDDFEGKSLIISPRTFKHDWSYFTSKDFSNKEFFESIRMGIFNSGSYIMNIEKMRKDNISIEKIIKVVDEIPTIPKCTAKYQTDEGILTIIYIDKMKYFNYSNRKELWYKPYNLTMAVFSKKEDKGGGMKKLEYEPKIIHFAAYKMPKPWKLIEGLVAEGVFQAGQAMSLRNILEIASKTKYSELKYQKDTTLNQTIIEPGMIPFFEYWFNVDDLVKRELKQIFG